VAAAERQTVSALMNSEAKRPILFRLLAAAIALECAYPAIRIAVDLQIVQLPGTFGEPTLALAMALSSVAGLMLAVACAFFVAPASASRVVFAVILVLVGTGAWVSHRAIAHLVVSGLGHGPSNAALGGRGRG